MLTRPVSSRTCRHVPEPDPWRVRPDSQPTGPFSHPAAEPSYPQSLVTPPPTRNARPGHVAKKAHDYSCPGSRVVGGKNLIAASPPVGAAPVGTAPVAFPCALTAHSG